jgi:hypothetical protein
MSDKDSRMSCLRQVDLAEENRKIRYMRILTDLTFQRLCVENMTLPEARHAVDELRAAAGRMFPGKLSVFELVIEPRMERVIRERFGSGTAAPHSYN